MSKTKKTRYLKNPSNLATGFNIFWFLSCFFALMDVCFRAETSDLETKIILLCLSIIFFYKCIKNIRNRRIFNLKDKYSAILQHQDNISLNRLVGIMNSNEKKVVKELNLLILYNFLGDAFIDMDKKLLILNKDAPVPKPKKKYTLKCDRCGGTTIIEEGEVAKCEYCGSLLQYASNN